PKNMAATTIVIARQANTRTPRTIARLPASRANLHRCCNMLGGAGVSMRAVSHTGDAGRPISQYGCVAPIGSLMFRYRRCAPDHRSLTSLAGDRPGPAKTGRPEQKVEANSVGWNAGSPEQDLADHGRVRCGRRPGPVGLLEQLRL